MRSREAYRVLILASLLAGTPVLGADLFPEETAFRAVFDGSPVSLAGRVVDPSGKPLAGCALRLDAGDSAVSEADGTFVLAGLSRSNQLLTITSTGYYTQVLPVQLFVPLARTNIVLPPVVLCPDTPSVARFLFGGDTAFARRMLDPEEQAPRDQMPIENPDALIQVFDPLPGTLDAVHFMRPLFLAADYPVVNFESVVTLDPSTPHLQKDFCYFSLPGSLPALKSLNIDYVGLGNNHTYDYLESGVSNTCYYLAQAGIHYSGLGSNSAAAFVPYRTDIKGTPCSFLAMTSIGGERYETNYVAGPDKGGAAYIESKTEARQAIAAERAADYVTIVQPHVGDEYTFEPSAFALNWMKLGVDAGADLIVSHHTHVAQGFGMYRDVLLVHCLGNFCFDQDRHETMLGLVATVDMEGHRLRQAWGTPIYLEDYRPRFISGRLASVMLRRISEFSQQLRVFPYNGRAWVASQPGQYSFADRRIVVPVILGTNGFTVLDLRNLAVPEESLARIEADIPGLVVRPGRDLMNFGDFEDFDVDGEQGEASRWDFSTNTTVALQKPYRGTAALCLYRKSSYTADAVAAFRNRVRVMGDSRNTPNKELSLLGYVRGREAGRVSVVSRYYASEGTAEFGEEVALDNPGGTFGWRPFVQDLHLPADDPGQPGDPPAVNARAVRVFLHHSPPATGSGYAWFDELAIVSWEEVLDPLGGPVLDTPHARDFLRVQGPIGEYELALTFRSYRPSEADAGHGPGLALETEQADQSVDRLGFPPTSVGLDSALRLVARNRGDQSLVVSNLTFVSGNSTDFLARWLPADGSPENGPVLLVAPETAARLEVRFAPLSAGPREAVLQFQSNDPDEGESLVTLVVGGEAYADTPVRSISENRSRSPTIRVQVPLTITPTNLLQEQLPSGLTPANLGEGGRWDPVSRIVQWQDLKPGDTVTYSLSGPSDVYSIWGWIAWGEQVDVTAGDSTAIVLAPTDSDGDGLPDWWEQKFFDSRTAAIPEVDSDGDGQNNLAEFLAGTHPLDGGFQAQQWAPYLRLRILDDQSAEFTVLGFDGATYRIEESPDLKNWSSAATNLLSGQALVLPGSIPPGMPSRFYRAATEER